MNRLFIVAVLTVTMTIMMSTVGYAIVAPHNLACDNCHGKFLSGGGALAANNACIGCHSSSGEAPRMPFQTGDSSNHFRNLSGYPTKGTKSSHIWGASTPYSVQANVQEPLASTGIDSGYSGMSLVNMSLCIRCHNAKQDTVIADKKPFLRASNVNDALCLSCHRARQTSTSATGSHPVAYRAYSTVYKTNTTAFRKTPLAGNVNNPTSNPGNYLSNGKIVCSTCHAPHYADSSSASFGNRSTANGVAQDDPANGIKGQLQNSNGTLLRTDAIGATATAINACSSCHKETANLNHNGKGQNIQCDHCHGAHVDYTGDASLPNLKLVRRDFSGMSTAKVKLGANVKVLYNSATSLRFKRTDNKGICQICHTPTPGVAIHDVDNTKAADCIVCHKHSNGFSAASCNSCHGQPPVSPIVGGPNGKSSSDYLVDEALTPHSVHATSGYYNYACKNCHYDGTPAQHHNTKAATGSATFQSVFVDTAGSVGATAGHMNIASDYNPGTRVCSNVYCHSNGDPRNGTFVPVATPPWALGKGKIIGTGTEVECSTCHGYGATLTTNAHQKHIASGLKCAVCHTATVSGAGQITDRTKHANGTKDVVFIAKPDNYIGPFTAELYNSSTATCTNSCHSNGAGVAASPAPVWTNPSTGACGTCHAAVATSTLHPFHFSAVNGPLLGANPDCASCHDYALGNGKHANGTTDRKPGNSCAPCHPATSGEPIWAVGYKVTCESCHVGTAAVVATVSGTYTAPLKSLTSGHALYSTGISKPVVCTTCHDGTKSHIGAGPAEKRLKLTGNAGNDLCNDCHTSSKTIITKPARIDIPAHGGSVNGFLQFTSASNLVNIAAVRSDACAGCHDTHGTTNLMSVRTVINGKTVVFNNTTTGFLSATLTGGFYTGLCQVCHTKTKYFRNSVDPSSYSHNGNKKCLTCHKHNGLINSLPMKYAFQPSGTCDTCHGYPPVKDMTGLGVSGNYSTAKIQDYIGGGGAHTVSGHISKTAVAKQEWTNCSNCHSSAPHNIGSTPVQSNVNVTVDPKFKFNSALPITYSANTCSNVSCHFKPSPNWVTGN